MQAHMRTIGGDPENSIKSENPTNPHKMMAAERCSLQSPVFGIVIFSLNVQLPNVLAGTVWTKYASIRA